MQPPSDQSSEQPAKDGIKQNSDKAISSRAVYLLLPPVFALGLVLKAPASVAYALQAFGGLMSGYAALVAAVFAAVKLTQEYRDWRQRKDDEKAAEIAGKAIVASIRFGNALQNLTSVLLVYANYATARSADDYTRFFADRFESMRGDHREFEESCSLAEAYLHNDAVLELRSLRSHYDSIDYSWLRFSVWNAPGSGRSPEVVTDAIKLCEETRQAIPQTVAQVVATLRQYTIGGRPH